MALSAYALPFGLRDVKIYPIDSAGTVGTGVDLPASRTFSFKESEDFQELRGDDVTIARRGNGPVVAWSLEAGGISLDAYKIIAGGNVASSGVSPNAKKTFSKLGTDSRPYFKVEGQVISDSGGDFHAVVYKCKSEGEIGGDFGEGQFFVTALAGQGIPDINNKLYDLVQNETAVAVT